MNFKEYIPSKKQIILPSIVIILLGVLNIKFINEINHLKKNTSEEIKKISLELNKKDEKIKLLESEVKDASFWLELNDDEKKKVRGDIENLRKKAEENKRKENISEFITSFGDKADKYIKLYGKYMKLFESAMNGGSDEDVVELVATVSEIDKFADELENFGTGDSMFEEVDELISNARIDLKDGVKKYLRISSGINSPKLLKQGHELIVNASKNIEKALGKTAELAEKLKINIK